MIASRWRGVVAILALSALMPRAAGVSAQSIGQIVGSAFATSKLGPVSVAVAGEGGASLNLTVSTGKQTFQFRVPARDLSRSGSMVTLDTRSDLGRYGHIHITWQAHEGEIEPVDGGCGSFRSTPLQGTVLADGSGSASLNLPCLGKLFLAFHGAARPMKMPAELPGVGQYRGAIADVSLSLADNAMVGLTMHRPLSPGARVDVTGFASRTMAGNDPLVFRMQVFHVTFPPDRLQITSDLGKSMMNLAGGPHPLKGSVLHMSAVDVAQPAATGPTTCASGSESGAVRSVNVQGTLGIQTCLLSGSFPVAADRTFGQLYSSSASAQAVNPLTITSTNPPDGAVNVPATLNTATVSFSNIMNRDFATVVVQGGNSVIVGTDPVWDSSGKTLTVSLTPSLQPNTTYTMTITAADTLHQIITAKTSFTTGA